MRTAVTVFCLLATAAWAADRDVSLKEGETRSFKLPGIMQVAIDDASVVEGSSKNDQLTVTARRAGRARVLVLLKSEQWVTFRVRVLESDDASGPLAEELPPEGEPVRLRIGEVRAFETPGVQRLAPPAKGVLEAKLSGKVLELRGVTPGRALVEVTLQGGRRVALPVVVEADPSVTRVGTTPSDRLEVPVSGELLLKAAEVEAVRVEDDDVAEVRIVGEGRVVIRGLQEGETVVSVRRAGRVQSYVVYVSPN